MTYDIGLNEQIAAVKSYEMALSDITPFARYVHTFTIDAANIFVQVKAYDHRLLYIASGRGTIQIGEEIYPIQAGTILLWQPGVEYSYDPDLSQPLNLYGINFDYTRRQHEKVRPIGPDRSSIFNPLQIVEVVHFTDFPLLNRPVCLQRVQHLERIFISMANEYLEHRNFCLEKIGAMLHILLLDIARMLTAAGSFSDQANNRADDIIAYIRQNYRQNLSNHDLSRQFNFHPAYINRLIRQHTGMSLHHYLIWHRLQIALNLLQTKNISITAIARQTGFSDLNYFSRCFRKYLGVSPRRYQAETRQQTDPA